jgi:hypothetical protein
MFSAELFGFSKAFSRMTQGAFTSAVTKDPTLRPNLRKLVLVITVEIESPE